MKLQADTADGCRELGLSVTIESAWLIGIFLVLFLVLCVYWNYNEKLKRGTKRMLYWYSWFYDNTNSFGSEQTSGVVINENEQDDAFAQHLAYLWPAIVIGESIEVESSDYIVRFLRRAGVKPEADIWEHLYISDEDGDENT